MRKKKSQVVKIVLNYKNEIICFSCTVNKFPYIATTIGNLISMSNWEFGPITDVLVAIEAIEKVAARCGFTRMETYIDHSMPNYELLDDYIANHDGIKEWVDKRFTRNEWTIKV